MPREKLTAERLNALSAEALDQLRTACEDDIAQMKAQISNAKVTATTRGVYSDADWFGRVNTALRFAGRDHQNILREIAKRNKADRRTAHHTRERAFIRVAARRLSPELLADLWAEVDDLQATLATEGDR